MEATNQTLKRKTDMLLNNNNYILLTKEEILNLIAIGEEISTANHARYNERAIYKTIEDRYCF